MDGLGLATAKGHLFVTLEDEEGLVNLIVRPDVYERYRDVLRNAPLLWIEGLFWPINVIHAGIGWLAPITPLGNPSGRAHSIGFTHVRPIPLIHG